MPTGPFSPPAPPAPSSGAYTEFPAPFGRFLLLKRLSRGGMGEIFLARSGEIAGFEKFVIIKKILPSVAANDDFITRFVDEARIAIKLNHVNIAQVFEVGRVEGEYFLTIEYIEGRDVRRLLRRCRELSVRLPVDLCVYIARELGAGLAYAHRRTGSKGEALSLVHCDISPPNLMVSYEGEVKVIDFGIARSALRTADSNPNVGFGKFGYMAPEQLLRGGVIDRRTDIYASGVVLYEMLTGERLYTFPEGTDYRQMARVVCQGNFTPPAQKDPRIDPQLDAIVCKALATRPEDRYQFAEEFRDALQQKLYQLNPTISADTLAATMDELFGSERQREHDELAQMRALDTSAYHDELAGAAGHTVTFARALEDGRLIGVPPSGPLPPGGIPGLPYPAAPGRPSGARPPSSAEAATTVVPTLAGADADGTPVTPHLKQRESDRRRRTIVPVLLGLLAFGAVVGTGYVVTRPRVLMSPPLPLPPAPRPAPVTTPAPAPTPPVPVPVPVAEPLPAPEPTPPVKRPPVRPPVPRPRQGVRTEERATTEAAQKALIDQKYLQVRREYEEYKRQFGARLEARWQAILSDIALGRRDQSLSLALDALRRDMKASKAEKPE